MNLVLGAIVVAFGTGLITLAGLVFVNPRLAQLFLQQFASSARAHYIEQIIRLIIGGAMVLFSPTMWHSVIFLYFGWILVITAAGLMLIPWRWHHRFAEWVVPQAVRHLKLFAVGSFSLGAFIVYGSSRFIFS